MEEWIKIIGALGGLEAIRFTVTFLANRKTNARKEKATAEFSGCTRCLVYHIGCVPHP